MALLLATRPALARLPSGEQHGRSIYGWGNGALRKRSRLPKVTEPWGRSWEVD